MTVKHTKTGKIYQMIIKHTQWQPNIPNCLKYSKWPQNESTNPIARPSKIYPNLDFWFENISSGNHALSIKYFVVVVTACLLHLEKCDNAFPLISLRRGFSLDIRRCYL
jgi:hypothetical protein